MQATSDKTASANFTQTGETVGVIGIIGDVTGTAYGRTGYNLYYQQGRKDAFKSADPASAASFTFSATSATIGKTIQNPTTFFYNKGGDSGNGIYGSPYVPIYYNAWNATYTTGSNATTKIDGLEKTVKTVYDPCPVGYTVPSANTFTKFTTSNCTVSGSGRQYTENGKVLYFPFTGRRYYETGALSSVGSIGSYWVAVTNVVSKDGRLMSITATAVTSVQLSTDGVARASGDAIRPVSEDVRQH